MASVTKFTRSSCKNELRHLDRTIEHSNNQDINPELSTLNYNLSPDRNLTAYEFLKQRLSKVHVLNRADVKVMAGWVVTAPAGLTKEQQRAFFEETYKFLESRYGVENVIQATVHYDEGKKISVLDRWGNPVIDDNGDPVTEIVGNPHLHFYFTPITVDKKTNKEKVCASAVLNRRDLQRFHDDLRKHLNSTLDFSAPVLTGITKAQGGNVTVKQLKELSELREKVRKYETELSHSHSIKFED